MLFSLCTLFITIIYTVNIVKASLPLIQVDPKTQQFVDEYGRVRIFHGVNVVYKVPPYIPQLTGFTPQDSLSDIDLTNLRKWGFNVVRFYVSWMGVAPTPTTIDQNYLSQLQTAVTMMENHGIYTLLDNHQDVFSRYFCGEGVPDWIAEKNKGQYKEFPFPLANNITRDPTTGYPLLTECLNRTFAEYYLTDAVASGFNMLFTNQNGTQDALAAFWKTVATTFVNRSSILGYELINEPAFPSIVDVIELGLVDRVYLKPMYENLHNVIRTVDDKHLIFYEPCVFDVAQTGFTQGPGGPKYNDRQVFSYHVYCLDVNKRGEPKSDLVCDISDTALIEMRVSEAKRKQLGGMMMTEFGALSNSSKGIGEINRITGIADQSLQSWAYWQFKKYQDLTTQASPATTESFYDENGELELNKVKALSRTYAQAIAGLPTLVIYYPESSTFELRFIINTSIQQPTIIFLNEELNYPNGYDIVLTPTNSLKWTSSEQNYLEFLPTSSAQNGTTISIRIIQQSTKINWFSKSVKKISNWFKNLF